MAVASWKSGIVRMPTAPPRELWVFGYGSLMWRPGFAYVDRRPALLRGWRRRLCVY